MFTVFVADLGAVLERYLEFGEAAGRTRRILSTVLIPDRRD